MTKTTIMCENCEGSGVEVTEYITGGINDSLSPWQKYRERIEVCEDCGGCGSVQLSDLDFLRHQEEVEASSTLH